MTRMKQPKTFIHCGLLVVALTTASLQAAPVGTAFNYQGRLVQNGQVASNWVYSMSFALYDAASGGVFLGTNLLAVPVTNGLFNTPLDYGIQPFLFGDATWLEIGVTPDRVSPSPAYTTLAPRTRLAPTPSANWANVAGLARNVTNGAVRADGLSTSGAPSPGQVLGYNGTSLVWQTPGVTGSPWLLNGANTYFSGGNVGIGTTTPTFPLHVNSASTANSVLAALLEPNLTGGGYNQIYLGRSGAGNGCGTFTYTYDAANPPLSLLSLGLYGNSFTLNLRGNGNVGIGTGNPQAALDVRGNWDGGRPALQLGGQKPTIRFAPEPASGNQEWLIHLGSGGPGDLQFMRKDAFIYAPVLTLGADENVGIGTDNPTEKLHVAGSFLRVDGAGGEAAYLGGDGAGGEVHLGSLNAGVSTVALYNLTSGQYMHLAMKSCTIYGGADLAEPFQMSTAEIPKGSVVVIDPANPGKLKLSAQSYDKRVAGIISGANGVNPGIALQQQGVLEGGQNVALSGRVYVQADASNGPIEPGDLLTTSDTPGHAMKVTDSARAQGAILGKAMSALAGDKGMVLVLVTLQ